MKTEQGGEREGVAGGRSNSARRWRIGKVNKSLSSRQVEMDGEFSVISAPAAAATAVQTTLWHFPNLIKILSEIDTRAPPRQCSFQMYLSPKVLGGVNIYSGQIGLSLTSSSVMKSAGWNMTTVSSRTAAGASIHLSLFASNLGIQSTHLTIYSTMASPLAVIDPEFFITFLAF